MITTSAAARTSDLAAGEPAATFQPLRSHLAYLRLNADAEALPGVLDAARDEHLPVLDALEQLMASRPTPPRPASSPPGCTAALPAPWTLELSGVDLEICLFPQVGTLLICRQGGLANTEGA